MDTTIAMTTGAKVLPIMADPPILACPCPCPRHTRSPGRITSNARLIHRQTSRSMLCRLCRIEAPDSRSYCAAWWPGGSGHARSVTGLDDARLVGSDDELSPVPGRQLHHGPAGVGLDRGLADIELAGDLLVREPGRDEPDNLELAGRQVGH